MWSIVSRRVARSARPSRPLLLESLADRIVPSFAAPLTLGVGSGPASVAVGDFNGDGARDLVVANRDSNTVSVLLGNGHGSFQAAVNYAVGTLPHSVAVGDFNRDGITDIAVACAGGWFSPGSVSVLLGNRGGTFQAARNFATSGSTAVAVGDFNRDGILDIVVGNASNLDVGVLLGNGDGSFRTAGHYAQMGRPLSVAVGDFNRDGILDIAVANSAMLGGSPGLSVMLGNGDGSFRPAGSYYVGGSPVSVAVGDFNGDGVADLAVATSSQFGGSDGVSVLLSNGNGTFQARRFNAGNYPNAVAVGDFNGDGRLDLAVAGTTMSVLLGNGDGSFQAPQNVNAGDYPSAMAVGDFNGDGLADLAVANGTTNVSILLNDGAWAAASPTAFVNGVKGNVLL
jgi:hypothetical protein